MSKKQLELLRKISRLAHDLASAVDDLTTAESTDHLPSSDAKPVFEKRELQEDFQRLRNAIEAGASIEQEVAKLLDRSSKDRLKAFIQTNGLPIYSHLSKSAIQAQLVQLMRQGKAIGAPVKTLDKVA